MGLVQYANLVSLDKVELLYSSDSMNVLHLLIGSCREIRKYVLGHLSAVKLRLITTLVSLLVPIFFLLKNGHFYYNSVP